MWLLKGFFCHTASDYLCAIHGCFFECSLRLILLLMLASFLWLELGLVERELTLLSWDKLSIQWSWRLVYDSNSQDMAQSVSCVVQLLFLELDLWAYCIGWSWELLANERYQVRWIGVLVVLVASIWAKRLCSGYSVVQDEGLKPRTRWQRHHLISTETPKQIHAQQNIP
jgi:hypothetical protein